jgi:hypothetical protein
VWLEEKNESDNKTKEREEKIAQEAPAASDTNWTRRRQRQPAPSALAFDRDACPCGQPSSGLMVRFLPRSAVRPRSH